MKFRSLSKAKLSLREKLPRLNLPQNYPWKVLSALLEDLKHLLTENDYLAMYNVMRKHDIAGYLSLSEVWTQQCTVVQDASIAETRAKYQVAQLLKKFRFDTDKTQRIASATEKFYAAEKACADFNSHGFEELKSGSTRFARHLLAYSRGFIERAIGTTVVGLSQQLLRNSRHGPGANLDTRGGMTSLYNKYGGWPYTCTQDAARYAMFAIQSDQRWLGALDDSYRDRYNIPKNLPIDRRLFLSRILKIVDANRVTFVPKSALTERTIAIEPTMNLYLQLGVDGYVRKRLKRFHVDLDSQERNQVLAYRGSIDPEGNESLTTIDLSAASDSVSIKLIELLFPPDWFSYLLALRSPNGELGASRISYEKISSMGNGYTFAIESLIFTALIYAVFKINGVPFTPDKFSVFGDDLIVPRSVFYQCVEGLRLFGFSLNLDKTYNFGPFRESCGTDWILGKPVRPVYLTEIPSMLHELFSDYNRMKRKLELFYGVSNGKTTSLMYSWIPQIFREITGPYSDEEFSSYIHVPTPGPQPGYSKTWMYGYNRLIYQPIRRKGRNFLFRKLMHDLRMAPEIPFYMRNTISWKLQAGSGSRFDICKRNSFRLRIQPTRASVWPGNYQELAPLRMS